MNWWLIPLCCVVAPITLAIASLLINVTLFPDMWRQDDVPKIIRWLAGREK